MFSFFKKNDPVADEKHYEAIKRLVADLPTGAGWAATYEKKLSPETILKLEQEGYLVISRTRSKNDIYYKISLKEK